MRKGASEGEVMPLSQIELAYPQIWPKEVPGNGARCKVTVAAPENFQVQSTGSTPVSSTLR